MRSRSDEVAGAVDEGLTLGPALAKDDLGEFADFPGIRLVGDFLVGAQTGEARLHESVGDGCVAGMARMPGARFMVSFHLESGDIAPVVLMSDLEVVEIRGEVVCDGDHVCVPVVAK